MFEKLKNRIKKDLGLSLIDFERCYAGKHMKGSGHFSWVAVDPESKNIYGSGKNATQLVKQKEKLSLIEDPCDSQNQFEIW